MKAMIRVERFYFRDYVLQVICERKGRHGKSELLRA